jgi:MFS family permease
MTEAAVGNKEPGSAEDHSRVTVIEEAVPLVEAREPSGVFRSLYYRDYRLLWTGTLFTSAGQWIQQVTVGWLVHSLTGSGFMLGAVNASRSLPLLALGPVGGVAADRVNRKYLLLASDLLLLAATAAIAAVTLAGLLAVWHLFAFSFATGVAWAFNNPVRQSVVPNLVPKSQLMNALALNSVGFNSMRMLGPSVGGLLVAEFGAGENFLLQACAYVAVVMSIIQLSVPRATRAASVSVRENLVEGSKYVWHHPQLRAQMTLALAPMVLGMPFMTLLPIFADEVLHKGAGGYGILLSSIGVGAMIGPLGLASLGSLQNKGRVLLGALFLFGIAIMLFSFSRSFPLSIGLLVLCGTAQMVYMTTNQTLLQLSVPDEMRGRVMGIWMLNIGLQPAGGVFAGAMADAIGAPTTTLIMGGLVSVFALVFALKTTAMHEV